MFQARAFARRAGAREFIIITRTAHSGILIVRGTGYDDNAGAREELPWPRFQPGSFIIYTSGVLPEKTRVDTAGIISR